ncbi:MAG: hypothetical protein JST23_09760 [Bacteroidetes bacterium]|nr:hypothetical protein [Bacteroidota bacterium]
MVKMFNKWLVLTIAIILGFPATHFAKNDLPYKYHPVHIATVEIDHNATDKTLEITCKMFWDDFETILTRMNNKVKVDLTNPKAKTENNQRVFNYIKSHLKLIVDGVAVPLNFLGFEREDIIVYSYLQINNISSVKQVDITSSLMYDVFEDQSEIIHVVVNGKRQSTKLNYPSTQANFSF